MFFPRFRADFARGTAGLLALIYYMRLGERRQVLTGQLAALLEHAVQKPEVEYRRIDIVAYSFGTVIAMDALFPVGRPPGGVSH